MPTRPRKPKKPVENKVETPPTPERPYNVCQCGSLRTGFNEVAGGQVRLYFCMTCSHTWEVPLEVINTQHGF